jgi:hypothetical protein
MNKMYIHHAPTSSAGQQPQPLNLNVGGGGAHQAAGLALLSNVAGAATGNNFVS